MAAAGKRAADALTAFSKVRREKEEGDIDLITLSLSMPERERRALGGSHPPHGAHVRAHRAPISL